MTKGRHRPHAPTGVRNLGGGAMIGAHRHDEHQIAYAARGVVSVRTRAGTWVAPQSRAVWIPAGTVHEHRAYGETSLHLVGLPVQDDPLGLPEPAVLIVSPLLRALVIAYIATRDQDQVRALDTARRHRLRTVLLDQLQASTQQPVHLPAPTDSRLVALCDAMQARPSDNRSLAALGREVGASSRTLSRLFRADVGMTFPQWRTQLRLHHALVLLAQGHPVTHVAHACGWASASAFIDVFKKAYGVTPGSRHTHPDAGAQVPHRPPNR